MNSTDVVMSFLSAMNSNDFRAASEWLSENFVCVWPQSKEMIRGRDNFVTINSKYPAAGKWLFDIQDINGVHSG